MADIHDLTRNQFMLKGLLFGQKGDGRKPSYLMVNCAAWEEGASQLHRFFGWNQVKLKGLPVEIQAGDCYLSETRSYGRLLLKGLRTIRNGCVMTAACRGTLELTRMSAVSMVSIRQFPADF